MVSCVETKLAKKDELIIQSQRFSAREISRNELYTLLCTVATQQSKNVLPQPS